MQEAMLKEELRSMERKQKREGVDMTYLKNVVVKLLETGEVEALLPVIAMLLQFSPEEGKYGKSEGYEIVEIRWGELDGPFITTLSDFIASMIHQGVNDLFQVYGSYTFLWLACPLWEVLSIKRSPKVFLRHQFLSWQISCVLIATSFMRMQMQKCQQAYRTSTDVPPTLASDASGSGVSLFSRFSFS
ncbi:hypothetical protein Patl1_29241 [Pistacia atlantica]|uniref:Uncharacterized protein n=1 Tax=Pistacia atlantica TaxID=434234 RepID=A0ACC1BG57_9ROSI|nr:hypothetical protein Patl1_29241 [Pistacia atlantica]